MIMSISKKLVYLGLALCIVALLISACTSTTAPVTTSTAVSTSASIPATTAAITSTQTKAPAPTSAPTAAPQYGGALKIIAGGPAENLGYPALPAPRYNPLIPYPCVEVLFRPDEKGVPSPWLASGYQWNADGTTLTITLNKGIKFHDGTDFNAAAVKYDLDLFLPPSPRPELANVKSIDIVDDYTVRLNLKAYDSLLMSHLCSVPGSMISPTAVKTYGDQWCMYHPVGTGPFKFVSFTRDVNVKYERFDGYWKGKPYLDSIEFMLITDTVTARAAFLAGEANVITGLGLADTIELKNSGKYNLVSCQQSCMALAGDSANSDSPFNDVRVRQAVSYAIDTKAIAGSIGRGIWKTTNQIANAGDWGYSPDVAGYPYNPQKARELLKAAGYPNGFKAELIYTTGNPDQQSAWLAIQQNLKDVGIEITLNAGTSSKTSQYVAQGWKNALLTLSAMVEVGYPTIRAYTLNFVKSSNEYKSILRPDDVDNTYQAAVKETNLAAQQKLVWDMQKLAFDVNCLVTPIYINFINGATYPNVHGIRLFDPWWVHWRPENTWLSK
jgi:peptide/nickel transport system substrate-binding protein